MDDGVVIAVMPVAAVVSLVCNLLVIAVCSLGVRGFWPALGLWSRNRNPALVALGIILICAGLAVNSAIWAPFRLARIGDWEAMLVLYREFGGFTDIFGKGLPALGVWVLLWAKLDAIYPPSERSRWNILNVAWFPHSDRILPRALSLRWLRIPTKFGDR
ncbi:hypothetical protein [Paracoccus homiensis]|uniref:hypothetical protein n=1 Tax=Paracoccus homiensis TaxID=364199 RepID=UPI00398C8F1F